ALKNIEEIIKATDAIMVARGDMGVELGNHMVPAIQKKIISLCNNHGKPVITATQMLESMIEHSTPTRAEASDVANAIWDGTDAVMLSAETASGKYPVEAIRMMGKIIEEAEKTPRERPFLRHMELESITASMQVAASLIAEKISARWIIAVTESGKSCLEMSRFRPKNRVLGVTHSVKTMRRLCLYWGISPFYFDDIKITGVNLELKMLEEITRLGLAQTGDKIVYTHGDGAFFTRETSNSIRVEIVKSKQKVAGTGRLDEAEFEKAKITLDTDICASCQKCISVCPHDIWEVTQDQKKDTRINQKNAPNCSLDMACVEVCPTGAIEISLHLA
ncbi:MAG: 4Fe-4S dicluster domain-containing protein, partial [Bacteriovoracaceae bacterium]|nr:4Fe-4S dicluster domain-containing protein [Bacteriovoracaceae bacterium]